MADKDLERTLMELRDYEKNAKRLYESNPKAFDHVVWNWEEFVQGYRRTQTQDVKLEEKAPFFMGSLLTEQDCFPDEKSEVSVLLHDRYVPPFYHSLKFVKIVYALLKDKLNIAKLTFTSGVNAASAEFTTQNQIDRCPLCGIALNEKGICPKCGYKKA